MKRRKLEDNEPERRGRQKGNRITPDLVEAALQLQQHNRKRVNVPYDPRYAELARRCTIAFGPTDEELARYFNVEVGTIRYWCKHHPEFEEAIRESKDMVDSAVVEKLYHRAMGYSHPDTKIVVVDNGPGAGVRILKIPIIKHYPPDTGAAIFWLKNRQGWRDRIDHAHQDPNGQPVQFGRVEHVIVQIDGTATRIEDPDPPGLPAPISKKKV